MNAFLSAVCVHGQKQIGAAGTLAGSLVDGLGFMLQ
jgi:hypothetical protein